MKQPIVYYISQGTTPEQHINHIKKMVDAGADWVQLRLKNTPKKQLLQLALSASEYCIKKQVNFMINDDVEVAKAVNAAGVHLGQKDQDPALARKILGPSKIIGGTANTWADCERLMDKKVDYIGLGPFRFTTTKKTLSPVLGIDAYYNIVDQMKQKANPIPIVAIGGITLSDIAPLRKTGVWGIALSGFLHQQHNLHHTIENIKENFKSPQLYEY